MVDVKSGVNTRFFPFTVFIDFDFLFVARFFIEIDDFGYHSFSVVQLCFKVPAVLLVMYAVQVAVLFIKIRF